MCPKRKDTFDDIDDFNYWHPETGDVVGLVYCKGCGYPFAGVPSYSHCAMCKPDTKDRTEESEVK